MELHRPQVPPKERQTLGTRDSEAMAGDPLRSVWTSHWHTKLATGLADTLGHCMLGDNLTFHRWEERQVEFGALSCPAI